MSSHKRRMNYRHFLQGSNTLTSHHFLPVVQGTLVSKPAFTIFPLIPAPRRSPNIWRKFNLLRKRVRKVVAREYYQSKRIDRLTVRRNKVTMSWSRGESLSIILLKGLDSWLSGCYSTRVLTETTSFNISFFTGTRVSIGIPQTCTLTYW